MNIPTEEKGLKRRTPTGPSVDTLDDGTVSVKEIHDELLYVQNRQSRIKRF